MPHEHRAGHADPARRQPQSDVRADDSAPHECHRELMLLARRVPGSTMIRADSAANSRAATTSNDVRLELACRPQRGVDLLHLLSARHPEPLGQAFPHGVRTEKPVTASEQHVPGGRPRRHRPVAPPPRRPPLDLPAPTTRPTTRRTGDPSPRAADGPRESPLGLQTNPGRVGRTRPFRGRLDCPEDLEGSGTRSRAPDGLGRPGNSSCPRRHMRSSRLTSPTSIPCSCAASTCMCSISTHTDLTDHSINAHPRAALRHVPTQPSGRYDETGSAASSTNTCRSHEVTRLSAPTRSTRFQLPSAAGVRRWSSGFPRVPVPMRPLVR